MHSRVPFRTIPIGAMSAAIAAMTATSVLAWPGDEEPPETVVLTGIIRDFKERTVAGGHPDFEHRPDRGFGHYGGYVGLALGEDDKPAFVNNCRKITEQWRDSEHRPISAALYDASRGDVEGRWGQSSDGGITSPDSFAQWFRDVPGVNLSKPLPLTFVRQPDGSYVFDDKDDPAYAGLGGFFPIDGELYGNSPGTPRHNFHFTFEMHVNFTYDADGAQWFKFTGDDDVFVYVGDRLVIDLGGVHAALDQYLDLSRLGLTDGETYTLHFFFAERHRTQSNFRIQTNLEMTPAEQRLPSITEAFD